MPAATLQHNGREYEFSYQKLYQDPETGIYYNQSNLVYEKSEVVNRTVEVGACRTIDIRTFNGIHMASEGEELVEKLASAANMIDGMLEEGWELHHTESGGRYIFHKLNE